MAWPGGRDVRRVLGDARPVVSRRVEHQCPRRETRADLFLLNGLAMFHVGAVGIAFIIGPIREVVMVVIWLNDRFLTIRETKELP